MKFFFWVDVSLFSNVATESHHSRAVWGCNPSLSLHLFTEKSHRSDKIHQQRREPSEGGETEIWAAQKSAQGEKTPSESLNWNILLWLWFIPCFLFVCFLAGEEVKSPDWGVGVWAGPQLPGERPEVPGVRWRAVGAAADREGEGETRSGRHPSHGLHRILHFTASECWRGSLCKTATEEEQTDGGGHAVWDGDTDPHQAPLPGHDHPQQNQKGGADRFDMNPASAAASVANTLPLCVPSAERHLQHLQRHLQQHHALSLLWDCVPLACAPPTALSKQGRFHLSDERIDKKS